MMKNGKNGTYAQSAGQAHKTGTETGYDLQEETFNLRKAYWKAGGDATLTVMITDPGCMTTVLRLRRDEAMETIRELGASRRLTVSGLIEGRRLKVVLGDIIPPDAA